MSYEVYEIYSLHVPEEGNVKEVLETRRTDARVALDDAIILRGILHRKAWVVEVGQS